MKTNLYQARLQVKKSSIHGYGVYAAEEIKAEQLIEECYALLIKKNALSNTEQNLDQYVFSADQDVAIALGNGSIYNHSKEPNAHYQLDREQELIVFRAARDIKCGEEIFISYGKDWFSQRAMREKSPSLIFKLRRLKSLTKVVLRFILVAVFLGLISGLMINGATK